MATSTQSNPIYYSLSAASSGEKPPPRTVVLHKKPDYSGFGVFIGEDVPSGLYVITVERNSPAADANIQAGDRVLAVNGRLVSSMSRNPRDEVIQTATNAESLTLTIQSTDIFQALDIPLKNSYKENNTYNQPQNSTKRTTPMNSNLENYIKSLFRNENVRISPSPKYDNEFIITSDTHVTSPTNANSSSYKTGQSHSNDYKSEHRPSQSSDYKPDYRPPQPTEYKPEHRLSQSSDYKLESRHPQSNDHKPERHHRHRHHRREPKPIHYETRATQTSNNEEEDEDEEIIEEQPQKLSRPITTAQVPATTSSPKQKQETLEPSKQPKRSSQHMAEVVHAAVAASKIQEPPTNRERAASRDPAPVTPQVSTPPASSPSQSPSPPETPPPPLPQNSARDPVTSRDPDTSRDPGAAVVPLTGVQSQEQNLPPPYAVSDTYAPANNQANANEGASNVHDAQDNQTDESAPPQPKFVASTTRPEGLRTINLHRSPDFEGYGFHLQYNKLYYLVQRIEEGSPAEAAGLHANDIVCSLNLQPTEGMAHARFVQIVTSSSEITMVVQYIDEYLRANPAPPRNPQAATAVSAALSSANTKTRSGPLQALTNITSR